MKSFLKIFSILTRKQMRICLLLIFLMLVIAVFEAFGIGLLYPLITIIGDTQWLDHHHRIAEILSFSQYEGSRKIVLSNLSHLAEAAPESVLSFLLAESDTGCIHQIVTGESDFSNCFSGLHSALAQLVETKSTAVQTCNLLYRLSQVQGNPSHVE